MYGNRIGNMTSIKKPESVMITIRNRKTNESKSLTVYDTDVKDVYEQIKRLFTR